MRAEGLYATSSTCLYEEAVRSDVLVPCKALPNKVYASVPLMQLLATSCPGGCAILKVLYGMYTSREHATHPWLVLLQAWSSAALAA